MDGDLAQNDRRKSNPPCAAHRSRNFGAIAPPHHSFPIGLLMLLVNVQSTSTVLHEAPNVGLAGCLPYTPAPASDGFSPSTRRLRELFALSCRA